MNFLSIVIDAFDLIIVKNVLARFALLFSLSIFLSSGDARIISGCHVWCLREFPTVLQLWRSDLHNIRTKDFAKYRSRSRRGKDLALP